MSILLDTHAWIWWLTGQLELLRRQAKALDRLVERQLPYLSAISLWEAQMLNAKGRLKVDLPFDRWLREAASPEVVRILPLDVEVVLGLSTLPARFHGDPADRIIVATARAFNLPLLSFDAAIRKARVVRLWKVP